MFIECLCLANYLKLDFDRFYHFYGLDRSGTKFSVDQSFGDYVLIIVYVNTGLI